MEFLQLPPEVIEGVLLPFLSWNDLLRLRRVCRTTKDIINHYLQVNSALAPEIEINEEDKTFGKFLEMGIPTQKIYLKNTSGCEFYDKDREDIALFLERYGGSITSLRVDQLSMFVFGTELEFMDILVNLQEMVIGHIGYGCKENSSNRSEAEINTYLEKYLAQLNPADRQNPERYVISKFMKRLKVLHVGQEENTWQRLRVVVDHTGLVYWMYNEATLEQVSLPFTSHTEPLDSPYPEHLRDPVYTLAFVFGNYFRAIEARASESRDIPKVKIIDFVNFHDPAMVQDVHVVCGRSRCFLRLCQTSIRFGVKVRNASPIWFIGFGEDQEGHDRFNSPELGDPVLSLVGLHPCVLRLEMPNLERIEIKATSSNSIGPNWRERRPQWPELKRLDITVDSKTSGHYANVFAGVPETVSVDTDSLFEFLFQDVVRENMAELRFNFTKDSDSVAVPNVADIVRSCPNLKKLAVVNWPENNKQLTELLEGLAELEEVSLKNCRGLENGEFIGGNTGRPVLLSLKKLRKLSLKGLDQMPKVTDLLFTKVIHHLPLTQLMLTSASPLKTVSIEGIRALLDGPFAHSIEKFSFQEFSLAGVSAHELKKLEQQFRSYYML